MREVRPAGDGGLSPAFSSPGGAEGEGGHGGEWNYHRDTENTEFGFNNVFESLISAVSVPRVETRLKPWAEYCSPSGRRMTDA